MSSTNRKYEIKHVADNVFYISGVITGTVITHYEKDTVCYSYKFHYYTKNNKRRVTVSSSGEHIHSLEELYKDIDKALDDAYRHIVRCSYLYTFNPYYK